MLLTQVLEHKRLHLFVAESGICKEVVQGGWDAVGELAVDGHPVREA